MGSCHNADTHKQFQGVSGFPYEVDSDKVKLKLKSADSLFFSDLRLAANVYEDILTHTTDPRLRTYCIFQSRLTHYILGKYSGQYRKDLIHFENDTSKFAIFLMQVDSVFGGEEVNEDPLLHYLHLFESNDYILGLGYLAIALHTNHYSGDDLQALEYVKNARHFLHRSVLGDKLNVFYCNEAIQIAKNNREYLYARSLGNNAKSIAGSHPHDTLIVGVAAVASGYSLLYFDLTYSIDQFLHGLRMVSPSIFDVLEQKVLQHLTLYTNMAQQDWAKYLDRLLESVAISGDYVNIHRTMGQIAFNAEDYHEAILHLNLALEHSYRKKRIDRLTVSVLHIDLQRAYLQLSQFDKALHSCLAQIQFELEPNFPLASLFEIFKDSLIGIKNNYIVSHEISTILFKRFEETGNREDLKYALYFSELSVDHISNPINTIEESKKITVFNDFAKYFTSHSARILHVFYELTGQLTYLEKYLNLIEKTKASIFYGNRMQLYIKYSIPDSLLVKEKRLQYNIEKSMHSSQKNNDSLRHWQDELKDLYQLYLAEYPEFINEKVRKYDYSLQEVQNFLDDEEAFISYHFIDDRIHLFIITSDDVQLSTVEYQASSLDSLLSMQRNWISGTYNQYAYEWYQKLVPKSVRSKCRIIINPSEQLLNLSFDALITNINHPGSYAIYQHGFVHTQSIDLLFSQDQMDFTLDPNQTLAIFSFSDYKSILRENMDLKELGGSLLEVKNISARYPNSFVSMGLNANVGSFKEVYSQKDYDIIHLALHGKSDENRRNAAFLIFRNPDSYEKYDSLYMYDVESLISKSKMVVISACESAKGKIIEREGTYSLARSFLSNGAEVVISSLWNLDDITTSLVMMNMYEDRQSPVHESLRLAKLNFLKGNHNTQPYFWASLISVY